MAKINLNNLKEIDFNELEFEQIGVWPLEVRLLALVGVFIASLAAGYFFILQSSIETYSYAISEENEKRDEFRVSYNQASNLEQYTKQMQEMQLIVAKMLQQLPQDEKIPELLEEISEQSQAAGVKLTLVRPKEKSKTDFYGELPFELQVSGNYHGFGKFVDKISRLSRVVTLHDFVIENRNVTAETGATSASIGRQLTMNMTAKTYWSLTDKELADD